MKILFTIFLILSLATVNAQSIKVASVTDFVQECTKNYDDGGLNKQMAIWLPYNFWEIIGDQINTPAEYIDNLVSQMKDYMLFCVVDYTSNGSNISFKSADEIRKSIKLTDTSKIALKPLEEGEISTDIKQLIQYLQPVFARLLGQFGGGMQLFLFRAKNINGHPAINVATKNTFTLSWNTTSLTWRLPLASVLPPKFCTTDNEKMQGNWNYCPIHGVKLDK
ncbi:MAG: hypothetical protein KF862_10295 [Chitinophagaceae bacterium]|nr:hypothetical protein [Chitinophagaceae bacterium]